MVSSALAISLVYLPSFASTTFASVVALPAFL